MYEEDGEWKGNNIKDDNAFIFMFRCNKRYACPERFHIISDESDWAFVLYKRENDFLFDVGGNDIIVKKSSFKGKCSCQQYFKKM